MLRFKQLSPTVGLALALAAPAVYPQAAPQSTEAGESVLGEIVVTARKRDESLKEVPVSISAVTSRDIEGRGLDSISDLGSSIPNVRLPANTSSLMSSGAYAYGMRGIVVNPRNIGFESGISTYVDGVYAGRTAAFNAPLADVERIELLRGPQGTLFGKNTIGGAINILTREATESPESSVSLSVGNRDAYEFQGRIAGPVAENLAGKITAIRSVRDGFARNEFNGEDVLYDDDTIGSRAGLVWRSGGGLKLALNADYLETRAIGPGAQADAAQGMIAAVPGLVLGPGLAQSVDGENGKLRSWRDEGGASLNADWEVGSYALTSITGWRSTRLRFISDDDASPWPIQSSNFDDRAKIFTQELRLASPADSRIRYVVGAYYFRQDATSDRFTLAGTPQGFNPAPFFPIYAVSPTTFGVVDFHSTVDTDAYAAFGSADFELGERWVLTTGIRYSDEEKTFDHTQTDSTWFGFGTHVFADQERSDSDVSGNLNLKYRFSDQGNVYASVSKGFKSGGFNADYVSRIVTFEPEQATSYELGLKSNAFDGRAYLTAAVFYTNYEKQQQNVFDSGAFVIRNAGRSKIKGGELELLVKPWPALQLNASYGYTDATFDEFKNCLRGGIHCDGNRLPFVPKSTAHLGAQYGVPVGTGELTFQVDGSYTGPLESNAQNTPRDHVSGYTLVDGSISYATSDRRWRLTLWSTNLLDKDYVVARYDFASLFNIYNMVVGMPRAYGVRVTFNAP